MKPILFSKNATSFSTNGLGTLTDVISCTVIEQRNGIYELDMVYPQTGIHFDDIELQSIICAPPYDGANNQPFRIYKISKPIDGRVNIYAQHISYQLSNIPCMPFGATNVQDCLLGLRDNAAEACPFTFWTDKSTVAIYTQTKPASIRERLGGISGSVLDIYGGDLEFDGYTVKLWNRRGANRNVTLRYGKNITDIKQEENISTTYTGICPYWAGGDATQVVTLPENVIESQYADNYPYKLTKVVDMSTDFTEAPTVAQLRARAQQYISDNDIGVPSVSITVNFIALWQTEEYKDVAVLQRIYLGDTITVIFESLGINTEARVIETKYDVLKERYSSIKIGNYTKSLADTIAQISSDSTEQASAMTTRLTQAIESATEQITGQNGGYIVTRYDGDGNPYELLIMDTNDINTAQKVWRWNNAGLGFSSTGYNGTYGTAITQDGKIVADFITAGTMSANRISGGVLELGGTDNANGQIYIYNSNGDRCGQINNAGIAIYSPNTSTQVIIAPDIGLVQRDSAGNIYYGLSVVEYPDLPALDYKYLIYHNGVEYDTLKITVADKVTEHIYGSLYQHKYKFHYVWNHTSASWGTTNTTNEGTTQVIVQLPDIFKEKNISVTVTPESLNTDKIATDTYLRSYTEYNTTLPKCKADGTSWTDTTYNEWTTSELDIGDTVSEALLSIYGGAGDMYQTAKDYAGTTTPYLSVPDPATYYTAMDPNDLGDFDANSNTVVYTLDNVNATITIDVDSRTTNGYNMNELLNLRVVAIC